MSAIQFLREKAGVFVAVIIGVALLLFVISDLIGNGRGQRKKEKEYFELGQIAGEYISYQDYEGRVQNLVEIYKLYGAQNIDEATMESLREQVWQQLIREKVQDSNFDRLGIGVSDEEVDEMVLGNNPHPIVLQLFTDQTTGTFNRDVFVNFLNQVEVDESARKYWLFFENEIINERMNSKFNTYIAKGLYATSKMAEFDNILNNATVDFSFIQKNYALISDDSVKITSSEIESYYSKHRETFKREALRDIEYVTFDVVPSEEDIAEAERWMEKAKTEFQASEDPAQYINLNADTRHTGFYVNIDEVPENIRDFVKKEDRNTVFGPFNEEGVLKAVRVIDAANRPDSVHVRHILIGASDMVSMEQTRVKADSLVKLLKSGASFETLARDNSDDQGSATLGGDLGWFSEGVMVVPFNNACFTAARGEIVTAETTYGTHIIEVLEQSKKSRKYNIGLLDRKILPGSTTNQMVYSEAGQFAGSNDTWEKFNKAVAEQKLNKRIANDVSPSQKTLPGLDNPRGLVISLFNAEEGSIILDNSQQAVFEIGDKYVVAYCTRVQKEGIAPRKDVENEIRIQLLKDKKAEMIEAEFSKMKGEGKTLDDLSAETGLNVQEATQINFRSYTIPGAGMEPALIAAASSAQEGVLSGPVKGLNGVYMFTVNSKTTPPEQDLELLKERLSMTYQMRGSYEVFEALRKGADIVDKRYKFY
ncbi:MAG: SurA N-terminal domain-containing protein [Bacteroidales bacterium]|nr:SurA N-terminal domain-containing protein [Bacteroidales bacterium]MBN2634429.1 SurA N-terminal domain-containing protein [Bacteroidales bacterium]